MNTDRVLARILGLRAFALVTGVSLVLGCAIEDGTGWSEALFLRKVGAQ